MIFWLLMLGCGLGLASWAAAVNPARNHSPEQVPLVWVTRAPYSFLRHPLYVGTWLYVTALAGLGGGLFVALAVGSVLELVLRDWVRRERTALNAETERITRMLKGDWYDDH